MFQLMLNFLFENISSVTFGKNHIMTLILFITTDIVKIG